MFKKDSIMPSTYVCSIECKDKRKEKKPKRITHKCVEYWIAKGYSVDEAKNIIHENSKKSTIRRPEYWIRRGYSEEDANTQVTQCQRHVSPRCAEYWIAQGYSEESASKQISEWQLQNEKKKEEKYTHEELQTMSGFSPKFWMARYGLNEEEAVALCKKNSNTVSLESFIGRYGEDLGMIKYTEFCNRMKIVNSVDSFVQKYGKQEGEHLWSKKYNNRAYSKVANDFFAQLCKYVPDGYKIYYAGGGNKEYGIRNGDKYYLCDFVIPDLKICVEFYGDYWHCNPKKYNADFFHKQSGVTASVIWESDRQRIAAIERLREFTVLIVWESDWHEMFDVIKEKILHAVTCKNNV